MQHRILFLFILLFGITTSVLPTAPAADILDIAFLQDGTAEDVSPMHNAVTTLASTTMYTYYNDVFGRYAARFNNATPGVTVTAGYYRTDYSNSDDVKTALAGGHSLEAFFMADIPAPLPNSEIKMFSAHESGGTGLMIGNSSRGNSLIFLPYVGSGYAWTNSGVQPQQGRYYHVVGVWDKSQSKSFIYVDGVLKDSANAAGNLKLPASAHQWFGVGADAGSPAQSCWKGDVAIARVYGKALSAGEVAALWDQVKDLKPGESHIGITGISFPSGIFVYRNAGYTIQGAGFAAGDRIRLQPLTGDGDAFTLDGTAGTNALTVTIPETFVAGTYRILLLREDKTQDLGFATLYLTPTGVMPAIIAHRGYWDTPGSAQNSIAALRKAQDLGVYGSEFDVWITTDGKIVLNHDPTISGIRIDNATYSQLQNITLGNGEKLPTLEDYLAQGKQNPAVKLILEFKTHSTDAKNNSVVAAALAMIAAENMTEQVEYIAFSLDICKEILRLQPGAKVAYLNGDRAPSALHELQITGIDYNISVLRSHPEWIREAHDLGMTVNVWTVSTEAAIREMMEAGADYITTDNPVLGKGLTTGIAPPRAAADDITFRYRSPGEIVIQSREEITSVALFDMQRRLRHLPVKSAETVLSLSGLPAGIYIIRVVTVHGTVARKIWKSAKR